MIRVVVFLVLTAAFVKYVAIWLADHPGEISITWLGYRAEPPIGILVAAVGLVACATILLWSVLRLLYRAPRQIASTLASRRAAIGHLAIARGLLAVGAGDVEAARRFAAKAGRLVPGQPLLLMLEAQTAQLSGERDGAAVAFRAMVDRSDTKLFGLHGLFIEAQRRNDPVAARRYAEDAAKASPSLAWAGQAALEFRCRDGDWSGALEALERNRRGGLVDADAFRRQRAVLLTARALSLKDRDANTASELAQDAVKLCPGLVPAVALAGRLLAEAGEQRKAARTLEAGWRESPHPDIADAYADLVPGGSARDRLIRVRMLARLAEGHPESALALANAGLEAHEFAEARASLAPLTSVPTRRVATLMARIETAENGDTGLAREWMARAVHAAHDPAWTADGVIAESWMPVSPVTGRLDAFQWRVPVADLRPHGPLIDQAQRMVQIPSIPKPPPQATPPPVSDVSVKPPLKPADRIDRSPAHAPDDPGPDSEPILEPVLKRSGAGGKLRSWFLSGPLN